MKQSSLSILLILLLCRAAATAPVLRVPDESLPLAARWHWAMSEAAKFPKSAIWVLWSFQRQMPGNQIIGSFSTDGRQRPSLQEIISGHADDDSTLKNEARSALKHLEHSPEEHSQPVWRDVGILVKLSPDRAPSAASVSLLNLHFEIQGLPLVWIGRADPAESLQQTKHIYENISITELKNELITAVALHPQTKEVVAFLQAVLQKEKAGSLRGQAAFWLAESGDSPALQALQEQLPREKSREVIDQALAGMNETGTQEAQAANLRFAGKENPRMLREQAVFWLGQSESSRSAERLKAMIQDDPDMEIRKKAIFSLSQMPESLSLDTLIQVARGQDPEEVRKEAVFWLSQMASKRVSAVLKEAAESDQSVEVQKQALFALSELEGGAGVPELITIARTHPSAEIRKQAIFWLGESNDPKAREALLKMLEE